MDGKMMIDELAIEVTRRCDLHCAHCLRGDAESMDINIQDVNAVLDRCSHIFKLIFTGGEPSLNVPALTAVRKSLCERDVSVGVFRMFTNGAGADDEAFALELLQLCRMVECKEECEVMLSNTEFHGQRSLGLLEGLRFFGKRYSKDGRKLTYLAGEGRGAKLKRRKTHPVQLLKPIQVASDDIIDGGVYLNCEGNVIAGCDWSYESQRKPENMFSTAAGFWDKIHDMARREPCGRKS